LLGRSLGMYLASTSRQLFCQRNVQSNFRRQFHICGTLGLARGMNANSPPPPPQVGQWVEATQSFPQANTDAFSALTHDHNSIHSADSDNNSGDPIVHGLLVASSFPSAFAACFPGAVYRSQTLTFRAAVPVGDNVKSRVTVERVRLIKNGHGGN